MEESMGFLTKYMQNFMAVSRKLWDAEEEKGVSGKGVRGSWQICLLELNYSRHCPSLCLH
jgi:hypothetical protein